MFQTLLRSTKKSLQYDTLSLRIALLSSKYERKVLFSDFGIHLSEIGFTDYT